MGRILVRIFENASFMPSKSQYTFDNLGQTLKGKFLLGIRQHKVPRTSFLGAIAKGIFPSAPPAFLTARHSSG
jgi:hypothetical protein